MVLVTDACYNNNGAPNWCSSNNATGQDDYMCSAHFDIQTSGPSGGNGPAAVGMDGQAWNCKFSRCYFFEVLGVLGAEGREVGRWMLMRCRWRGFCAV